MIYIRAFYLKKTYLLLFLTVAAFLLVGLSTVLAVSRDIPATSWLLANRVIIIDPGHGGIDPGAVNGSLKEKDIVLNISKRLADVLRQSGARAILTREIDTDLGTPGSGSLLTRKREDLAKRVKMAEDNRASVYLSIHVNSFPSARWRGAQTFYQRNEKASKVLAEAVQSELIRVMGNTKRSVKAGDFFTTRNADMAAVIIEVGFLSNPTEAKLMAEPAYQRKLAQAICAGLIKYYAQQASPAPQY